jgi:hypothetical protein
LFRGSLPVRGRILGSRGERAVSYIRTQIASGRKKSAAHADFLDT